MIVHTHIKSSAKKVRKSRKNPANQTKTEVKTYVQPAFVAPRGSHTII